jgi:methyl-accepting chemotaxis protein
MRKKFLIKPALQLRHLAWTLAVVLVCFVSCYALFETLISRVVEQGSLDPLQWEALKAPLRLGFSVALIILLGAIGIENYLFFHSIAGPLYVLERGLRRLADGDFKAETHIRDTDQLRDVIIAFRDMQTRIAERVDGQEKAVRALADEIDQVLANAKSVSPETLLAKLKAIKEQAEKLAA